MIITLYITASLSCDFVLKDFILSMPSAEHDVSYLCVSEEKTNQLLKILGNWFFSYLLTNKQLSTEILDSENRELVWPNLPLKCIVLMAFFRIINTLLIELFVWPQTIEA